MPPIRLYVSSSPELAPEREALGRAVASLPVSIGWEIHHTPAPGEPVGEVLPFVASCDLYVAILGADFAAPMGSEWQRAMEGERYVLAFYREGLHSPSAQWVLQQRQVEWEPFTSVGDLEGLLVRRLARVLLDRGERLGLHLEDVEGLLALLAEEGERPDEPDRRRGAGRSGVILGREGPAR
ncbi:MAG TPA: hypothetical protein EYH30_10925 [Anaerolineales bacterium]|nr:hypothetical protein [Anaerolineae bacterium]HIQ02609.1 hypothetical protein [Anaerolineales bacterium]